MKYISVWIWLDVFLLAREVIIVAFGAELGADGAWSAPGAFALAGLAGGAGDAGAFSYGGIGHGEKARNILADENVNEHFQFTFVTVRREAGEVEEINAVGVKLNSCDRR